MKRLLSITLLLGISTFCLTALHSYRSEANQESNRVSFGERERIIIKKSDFNPPVWIKRTKAKKGVVQLSKRFEDDDDWLRGFSVGILNASNKPVLHITVEMLFRHEEDLRQPPAGWFLNYGVDPLAYESANRMPASKTPNVMPGGDIELTLRDNEFSELMQFLQKAGFPNHVHSVEIRIISIGFSDGTIWNSGKMLRRDADRPGKWLPVAGSVGTIVR